MIMGKLFCKMRILLHLMSWDSCSSLIHTMCLDGKSEVISLEKPYNIFFFLDSLVFIYIECAILCLSTEDSSTSHWCSRMVVSRYTMLL